MTITGMGQIRLKLCRLFSKVYSRQCSTSTLYCKIYVWLPPAAVNNTQSKPNTRKKEQGRCTVTTIFYKQFSSTPTQHARDRWSKYITLLCQLRFNTTACAETTHWLPHTAHNWTCTPRAWCSAFPCTDRHKCGTFSFFFTSQDT